MKLGEKQINSIEIYKGPIFTVKHDRVELPDESISFRDVVVGADAVGIVPIEYDENGECYVYLIEQFRYATGETLLEIPAGKIDPGEELLETARRELQEEIGLYPSKLKWLSSAYASPGYSKEKIHIFLATDLIKKSLDKDKDEFLNIRKMKLTEAWDKVRFGMIKDGKTIIGISLVYQL